MESEHTNRCSQKEEQELSVSDAATHDQKYPFLDEFSEFLSSVPVHSLKYKLLTYQQRLFAEAMWAAENFGGDQNKCISWLEDIYGPNWRELTSVQEHMAEKRTYYEYVLILDHQRQWKNVKNLIT